MTGVVLKKAIEGQLTCAIKPTPPPHNGSGGLWPARQLRQQTPTTAAKQCHNVHKHASSSANNSNKLKSTIVRTFHNNYTPVVSDQNKVST